VYSVVVLLGGSVLALLITTKSPYVAGVNTKPALIILAVPDATIPEMDTLSPAATVTLFARSLPDILPAAMVTTNPPTGSAPFFLTLNVAVAV